MKKRMLLIGIVLTGILFAAEPIGTVTSLDVFELRGTAVNTGGVPSWPMVAGDDVKTTGSSATIRFKDGSQVVLAANSQAKVVREDGGLVLRLVSGSMKVTLSHDSHLTVINKPSAPTATSTGGSSSPARALDTPCVKACLRCPPPSSCP